MTFKRNDECEIYYPTNKVITLYCVFWKYFYYPSAIEARKERSTRDPENMIHLLIW